MTEEQKQVLSRGISKDHIFIKYHQFIDYVKTGEIDEMEYKIFYEQSLKRDVIALAHAYFNKLINFGDYYNTIISIVGLDLIIQEIIKQKNNGNSNSIKTG